MALIVEDGTVVAGAESYISVADADLHHSNLGHTAWAALNNPAKEAALRNATNYMVGIYRLRWKGYRKSSLQTLDWPRINVPIEDLGYAGLLINVASNIVPNEVRNACAELALKASAGDLAPDIGRMTTKEKVGPVEVDYQPGGVQYVRYRAIDFMLKIYLQPSGSPMVRL